VLYLDWESVPDEIEERLYLLSRGLGCSAEGLHYRRMSRSLADDAAALRTEISRLGVQLVIVDSLGPACGAEPESADAAVRAMNVLRSFGTVTRLVIAHVSKASAEQQRGAARPYGSVFVQNLARSVWEIRRSEDDGSDNLVVALYHRKANRGRLHAPIGLRYLFEPDSITIRNADLRDSDELLARASLSQRIRAILAGGAKTTVEVATAIDADEESVKRTLRRMASNGKAVRLPDGGIVRWGLSA
jgi:hypothetical protein